MNIPGHKFLYFFEKRFIYNLIIFWHVFGDLLNYKWNCTGFKNNNESFIILGV